MREGRRELVHVGVGKRQTIPVNSLYLHSLGIQGLKWFVSVKDFPRINMKDTLLDRSQ